MIDDKGQHVLVTPSVIYSETSAIAAVNGGDDGVILLRFAGWDDEENRRVWEWRIYDCDHKEVGSDDDLKSPEWEDALGAMGSLLSFLGAVAEARDESSENWTLFTPGVRDFAKIYSDELSLIADEVTTEQELSTERGAPLRKAH